MKITLISLFLLLAGQLVAQGKFSGSVRWDEVMPVKPGETSPVLLGNTGSTLYALCYSQKAAIDYAKRKVITLQAYELPSLAFQQEKVVVREYNDCDLFVGRSVVFGDKPLFVSFYHERKSDKIVYLLHRFQNGVVSDAKVIAEVTDMRKHDLKVNDEEDDTTSWAKLFISKDLKSLLITLPYEQKDSERIENAPLQTVLFDRQLNELKRGKLEMPDFLTSDMELADDGRLFISGFTAVYEQSDLKKRKGAKKGKCYLLIYDGARLERIAIADTEKIEVADVKPLEDGSAVVYGMYTEPGEKGISGVFFTKINPDKTTAFYTFEALDEEFISQIWNRDRQEKGREVPDSGIYSHALHDLVVKENGDLLLLAEQYFAYLTTYTYTASDGMSTMGMNIHRHYDDIIAVNCTATGNVSWKNTIQKHQYGMSADDHGVPIVPKYGINATDHCSFFAVVQGNNVRLIYNDNEANINKEEMLKASRKEWFRALERSVAMLAGFDEAGAVSSVRLLSAEEDAAHTIYPRYCKKLETNEILLYTNGPNYTRTLGWLTL